MKSNQQLKKLISDDNKKFFIKKQLLKRII